MDGEGGPRATGPGAERSLPEWMARAGSGPRAREAGGDARWEPKRRQMCCMFLMFIVIGFANSGGIRVV